MSDLLDMADMEAARLRIESVELDVRHLVEDVAGELRVPPQAKSLDLRCRLPADLPSVVRGDPGRLRQVVTNLVANAVKFTPSVAISVAMTMDDVDETTVIARFEVSDTGIGIAPAGQAAMFDPFSQADDSDTRTYGGAGLGLAISRHLVELMGGEIGVRSVPGQGSTFWFIIPLQRVHSERALPAA